MPLDNPTQRPPPTLPSPPATLADASLALEARVDLGESRKRDMISAIRRIAELVGMPPVRLPAAPAALAPLLAAVTPATHGISAKTWSNLRSNLAAALREAGVRRGPPRPAPLSPTWQALFGPVRDKRLRCALTRLVHWCSARGIAPVAVDDAVFAAFRAELEDSFVRRPRDVVRCASRVWNEATTTVADWPTTRLTVPDFRKPRVRLTLEELPGSFREEVERYFAWCADADPFAPDPPPRILKPGTIRLRRDQLLSAASALIRSGMPTASLTGLDVLVEPTAVERLLRQRYTDGGQIVTAFDRSIATMLFAIAKHWVKVEAADRDKLRKLRRKLGGQPSGLTAKNRAFLRQFDDPQNVTKLLLLPEALAADARRNSLPPERRALLMQLAAAIEIELHAPLRLSNLVGLEIGRHLRQARAGAPWFISLEADETKNDRNADYELARNPSRLIDQYVHDYRPELMAGDGTDRLFVMQDGLPKAASTLSQQVVEEIRERTGLKMTVHQFRHLAAALMLKEMPEALHIVQRLLGHKSLKTTLAFYAELSGRQASAEMAKVLEKRRRRGARS